MGSFAKFYFRPAKGEWIHTEVSPSEDEGCGIIGRVVEEGQGVKNALVLLFEADGSAARRLVASVATDEDGEFAFGPLTCGGLYVVKIYRDELKLRELEIRV